MLWFGFGWQVGGSIGFPNRWFFAKGGSRQRSLRALPTANLPYTPLLICENQCESVSGVEN
jgi:hypothetical protein